MAGLAALVACLALLAVGRRHGCMVGGWVMSRQGCGVHVRVRTSSRHHIWSRLPAFRHSMHQLSRICLLRCHQLVSRIITTLLT